MKKFLLIILCCFISSGLTAQAWMQYLPQSKTEKELTFYDYQAAFKNWCQVKGIDKTGYYKNKNGVNQKAYGWKQFRRWEQEMSSLSMYNKTTGEFIRTEAMNRPLNALRNPPGPATTLSGSWTNLGYSVTSSGYNGIGRLNTIAFHPTNPDIFWVGAPRGGIWVTEDHGSTWTPLSDNIAQIGIAAIAIPSDYETSQTIYIGTGDRGLWGDLGAGILKSTNGGATWQETSMTLDVLDDFYIGRILIHPESNLTQYAGTNLGVYYTTDGWDSYSILSADRVIDMEFRPGRPDTIYVSTKNMQGVSFIKRSFDGGMTWEVILAKVGGIRTEIAVSPDQPDYLYAVVSGSDRGLEGVYFSDDAGETFAKQLDGSVFGNNILCGECNGMAEGGQGGYDLCIAVNPLDATDIWVGGINLWHSNDSGLTWDIVGHWTEGCAGDAQIIHADHHWLEFQYNSEKLFDCNDGGIYYMEYGQNFNYFVDISEGLTINQIYRLSNSQQHEDEIIMGLQDNSTVLWSGGDYRTWSTGDGTDCLINPDNDNIQYYCGNTGPPNFTIFHWAFSDSFHVGNDSATTWYKAFRLQPSNTNVVYYGLTNLYKSTDFGSNFSLLYDPPDLSQIQEIAISASNPDVILFSNETNLYKTEDGGTTWETITQYLPAEVMAIYISEIVIKNDDESRIWFSYSTWNANQVFESLDGGYSWSSISDGLPDAPVLDLIQNTAVTGFPELYAAGYYGVYVKLGNQHWIPFNSGLPNLTVNDVDIYYAGNKLRAGTWGRGFWETPLFSTESGMPGLWTGAFSSDWNDYRNWQYMEVPSYNEDVTIPADFRFSPNITTNDAVCKNITIEAGAWLNISGYQLTVMGSANINGGLKMMAPDSKLEVQQDLIFGNNSGFYAYNSSNLQIDIYRHLYLMPGAEDIAFDSATVTFSGAEFSSIFSNGNNCGFGNLSINKSSGRSLSIDGSSTKLLFVRGNITVGPNSKFHHYSEMDLNLRGNLNNFGDFFFDNGKLKLTGWDKQIYMSNSSSYVNNLEINIYNSSEVTLQSDLQVRGAMTLVSGDFNPAGYSLKLDKDLVNAGGNLLPGTGRIIFDGTGPQEISGNFNFNTFEIAKTSDTLHITDYDTINCNNYYYTSGILKVGGPSVFTANDLMQSGIYGHFILENPGRINLNNGTGSVSLNGIIKIYGGKFTVDGGNSTSQWPGTMNSELWISSGVLDFKDHGIYLNNSFNLTEMITGGVIRTAGSFVCDRNDFTPAGGNIELYGPLNTSVSHSIGSSFYGLQINKSVSTNARFNKPTFKKGDKQIYIADSNSFVPNIGNNIFSDPQVTLISDLQVRGDLTLMNGSLNQATYILKLEKNLLDAGGNLLHGTGIVTFNGTGPQEILGNFNFNTFKIAKPSDTLHITSNDTISCSNYDYTSGILKVGGSSVFTANDLLQNGIYGHFILKNNGRINLNNGTGSVSLNGIIKIYGGNFIVDGGNSTSEWPGTMNSELWISGGVLDFNDHGIYLTDNYDLLEVITGGVIRTAGSFVSERNDFTPVGGYIELYGPLDASLSHGIGGSFYDLHINKNVSADLGLYKPTVKKKAPPSSGLRSGKATVIQNLTIDHSLEIVTGELDINGKTVDIQRTLDITGTLTMTNPTSVINVNQGVIWRPGSSSDISEGLITFKTSWYFYDGTNAQLSGNNMVKSVGGSNTDIYHRDADACFANFTTEKTGLFTYMDGNSEMPMRVNGILTVKDANTLYVGNGDLVVNGTLITENTSGLIIQNGGSIASNNAIIGNYTNIVDGSVFSSSNLTLNGTLNLTSGGDVDINNFTLNGTMEINAGSVGVHNNFTQAGGGHLILDGGAFILDKAYSGTLFGFSGITDLNGGFFEISYEGIQFGTGAIVNFNGGNLRVGGHFRAIQADSFKPSAGAVELINTIGANIEVNNGNYFHQLIINKSGANPCYFLSPLTVQDNLTLQSGELSTFNNSLTIGNNLLIGSSGRLSPGSGAVYIGGNWTNNRGTYGFNEGTSSVVFYSSQPATSGPETFYNLDIDKALSSGQHLSFTTGAAINVTNKLTIGDGALLMGNNSTLTVNGELMIKEGAGLNANPSATGVVINCKGNWSDYNTLTNADMGFYSGQSNVIFKGTTDQELLAYGGATFYNLTFEKPSNSVFPNNNITVLNNFNIVSGNWDAIVSGLTHIFKGNFTCSDPNLWNDNMNTISFEGNQTQSLQNTGGGLLKFGTILVNRPESYDFNILSDISCSNKMKIIGGYVFAENYDMYLADSLVVLDGGHLYLYDNTTLSMGDNAGIHINGGTIYIAGSLVNRPLITRSGTGYYSFKVENGGIVQASYSDFEYMNDHGLDIEETGFIDGTFPFYNCLFSNGQSGGTLLLINNSQDVTLYTVDFPANTWSGTSNISKSVNTGNVYLPDARGEFAGPLFEYDPYNRIHWPSSGIWDGDFSTNWHSAKNWRYDYQSPDAATDVVIPAGTPFSPNLSAQEVTIKSLMMEPNTTLTISKDSLTVTTWSDIRGSLNLSQDYTAFFTDSIVWQAGSSASLASRATIYLSGDMLIRRGSNLDMNSGEFRFYGTGESSLVCHDTAQIYSLMNYKTAPYSLSLTGDTLAQLTINGNFENGPGATLKCPSTQEWVFNGNFRNTQEGHFRLGDGCIHLRGSITSTYFRVKPGDYFHDLTIETPTRVNLYKPLLSTYSDTLRINGNLLINPRTGGTSGITANNFKITLRGDWKNNAGTSAFLTGAGQTHKVIFWDPHERQEIRGNTIFNDIYALNESEAGLHIYDQVTASNMIVINPAHIHGTANISYANIDDNLSAIHLYDGCNMQINSLTQGGLIHSHGGTLNVTDLSQDYITGTYIVDDGLVILGQTEYTATHDLYFANLIINGGELRFTGGYGISEWPSLAVGSIATLAMTGGVFDLQNHNVEIKTGNFSENITGGRIRVPGQFYSWPGVISFHPTGGIVELYGDSDTDCGFTEPECWLYNLYINKDDGIGVFPAGSLRVKNELKLISGYMQLFGNPVFVGPGAEAD